MNEGLSKQKIEDSIIECNEILHNWFLQQKYYLINEHEIKGAIYNRLKTYCGSWRQQKLLLKMLRINIVNSQINNIALINLGGYEKLNLETYLNDTFNQIDYKSLFFSNNLDNDLKIKNNKEINFNIIENITF